MLDIFYTYNRSVKKSHYTIYSVELAYNNTSDTLKCRVPRSALWHRGLLWQIPNIVCWGLGDFDFEVLVQ